MRFPDISKYPARKIIFLTFMSVFVGFVKGDKHGLRPIRPTSAYPTKASSDCAVPAYRGVNKKQLLRAGRGGGPDALIENLFSTYSCLIQNKLLSLQPQTATIPMPEGSGSPEPPHGLGVKRDGM